MTHITTKALEKSTYVVTVAFTDESGAAVTPDSITWDLTDSSGNVVNGRSTVVIAVPAASNNIVLSGDDLAIPRAGILGRVLTIEAVYDSSMGTDLPFKDEITFEIAPLVNV
jgi:predicted NAD/FAD-dependent oxidoreductase